MKLTPEFFENDPNWIRLKDDVRPGIVAFESNTDHIRQYYHKWDKYLTVAFGVDNLTGGKGAYFTLDNGDGDTIASFDVETLQQANQILGVYSIRISKNCDLYFDPTWAGDMVIAEYALPIIISLARKTNSYPPDLDNDCTMAWKTWRMILGSIIFSLHQLQQDRIKDSYDWYVTKYGPNHDDYWPKWEVYFDRVQEGIENFGKYFQYLNW
jgi:hypothetical protein